MHEVVETHSFLITAKKAKMSDAEVSELIDYIALNPMAGEIIVGSGGCRKVRFSKQGKGKSGGYRVITYYYDVNNSVFLLFTYAKKQTENLKREHINMLSEIAKRLVK